MALTDDSDACVVPDEPLCQVAAGGGGCSRAGPLGSAYIVSQMGVLESHWFGCLPDAVSAVRKAMLRHREDCYPLNSRDTRDETLRSGQSRSSLAPTACIWAWWATQEAAAEGFEDMQQALRRLCLRFGDATMLNRPDTAGADGLNMSARRWPDGRSEHRPRADALADCGSLWSPSLIFSWWFAAGGVPGVLQRQEFGRARRAISETTGWCDGSDENDRSRGTRDDAQAVECCRRRCDGAADGLGGLRRCLLAGVGRSRTAGN